MKKLLLSGWMIAASFACMGQSLEKMQWFNEPEQWKIEGNSLSMEVTPQTDYWRISHYGFTVDDAPFLYSRPLKCILYLIINILIYKLL